MGAVANNITGGVDESIFKVVNNDTNSKNLAGTGFNFTSAQYAEILQFLGGNSLNSLNTNTANITGNLAECNAADWIIDTGANEHMTGP